MKMEFKVKVFVTNLGMYTEGKFHGDWLTLPADEYKIEDFLEEKVGINEPYYEEHFLTDWESEVPGLCEALNIGEYTNIFELSEKLEDMPEIYDEDALKAAFKVLTFEEAIKKVSDGEYAVYENCYDMTDVAVQVVEETGLLDNAPDNLANYFNYDMFGRDLEIEGNYVFYGNCYYQFFD